MLWFFAAANLPLIFLGYGVDNDSYGVIETALGLLHDASYVPSRHPGYPVHEVGVAAALWLGTGSIGTNLLTLAMSLTALGAFRLLALSMALPYSSWALAFMALQPFFWANATATIDYNWAVGLVLCGTLALTRQRPVWTSILFALSVGARFTSALSVASILSAWAFYFPERRKQTCAVALSSGLLGAAMFVPSWIHAGHTFSFLKGHLGSSVDLWTPFEHAIRIPYKIVLFAGFPFWGVLAFYLCCGGRGEIQRAPIPRERRAMLWASVSALATHGLLFARYPIEKEYLIATLPFIAWLLGEQVRSRRWVMAIVGASVLTNFISLDLQQTQEGARLMVSEGYMLRNLRGRWLYRRAETGADWVSVRQALGREDDFR